MKPVVGVDVSKGSSQMWVFLEKDRDYGKGFRFEHSGSGFTEFLSLLHEIERQCDKRPEIILEATGHYHLLVTQFLDEHGYLVIVVNPLTSQKAKRSHLRKIKTDKMDAKYLAQLYYKLNFRISKTLIDP